MLPDSNTQPREWGRYGLLLIALLVHLAVVPFLPQDAVAGTFLRLGWSAVVLAALLVSSRNRRVLWFALVLAVPVLGLRWTASLVDIPALRNAVPISSAIFLAFTAGVVLKEIFGDRRITLDEIFGGILVYILLGVVFGELHYALELVSPGAYLMNGAALSSTYSSSDWNLLISFRYFSFTTLTTLGYGDIQPHFPAARMLSIAEALVGQLYLAIFIARLVGSYISQRGSS